MNRGTIGFNGTDKCQINIYESEKKSKQITVDEMRKMLDDIIQDDNKILQVPLKDLIWTIICYSKDMKKYEDEVLMGKGQEEYHNNLIIRRECQACRRDELARIIGQYSDFDTQRIWKEVDEIFTKMCFI